jgi:hypothetical protein
MGGDAVSGIALPSTVPGHPFRTDGSERLVFYSTLVAIYTYIPSREAATDAGPVFYRGKICRIIAVDEDNCRLKRKEA